MRRILSNKLLLTGGFIMIFLILIATFVPMLVPYNPYEMVVDQRLQGPSAEHLLGTDNLGRDLLTRVAYGARVSLFVGLSVAIITAFFGLIIGLYASYYKTLDHILMRISDGLMSIPAILLAIALMAAIGTSTNNVILCLSVVFTPYVARVVRSAALVVKEQTYIEAMKALGQSDFKIIWKHIMPNTISPLIIQVTFIFAEAIVTESALSFLGVGVPSPEPSWGNILYDGKLVIFDAWWMTVFAGLLLFSAILGLNILGDGLRDLIDPHSNRGRK